MKQKKTVLPVSRNFLLFLEAVGLGLTGFDRYYLRCYVTAAIKFALFLITVILFFVGVYVESRVLIGFQICFLVLLAWGFIDLFFVYLNAITNMPWGPVIFRDNSKYVTFWIDRNESSGTGVLLAAFLFYAYVYARSSGNIVLVQ